MSGSVTTQALQLLHLVASLSDAATAIQQNPTTAIAQTSLINAIRVSDQEAHGPSKQNNPLHIICTCCAVHQKDYCSWSLMQTNPYMASAHAE